MIHSASEDENAGNSRPSILYLTFNVGFINPTRELLCDVLSEIANVTFYGPGFLPMDVLDEGIAAFVAAHGPYDFVVADETSIEDFSPLDQGEEVRFHNHACRFDRGLLWMGRDYQSFLRTYPGRRLIALLQTDYYNLPEQRIDVIEAIGDYFLTWGIEFIKPKSELDPADMRPDGLNMFAYSKSTDRYLDFLKRHPEKIISCPHFIADAELKNTRLVQRPYDWCVLGADYDARVAARETLEGAGLKQSGGWLRYVFALAHKLRVNLYDKYTTIAFVQWAFRRALRQAKFGFTCGSSVNWPIRKYYEIPASGSVLVCEKSNGFGALGFINRKNAVICHGKDILDAHAWLTADADRAQAIADAGRILVSERHSVPARARQIVAALERIRQGSFVGSRWCDGDFEILEC